MVLPQEPMEPVNEAVDAVVVTEVSGPVSPPEPEPEPVVAPAPEPEPEPMPEPDLAQQLTAAIIALRDAQMTHDDADTRQRKANMAVSDVETQRTAAVETQRLAVVSMGASRDGVLSAFDGLIATVQAARDAFRAG